MATALVLPVCSALLRGLLFSHWGSWSLRWILVSWFPICRTPPPPGVQSSFRWVTIQLIVIRALDPFAVTDYGAARLCDSPIHLPWLGCCWKSTGTIKLPLWSGSSGSFWSSPHELLGCSSGYVISTDNPSHHTALSLEKGSVFYFTFQIIGIFYTRSSQLAISERLCATY